MAHADDLLPGRAPLVEVLFELKWRLTPSAVEGRPPTDPSYKLLVGSFYDRVKGEYPFHEPLPAAGVPDEFVPQLVQHRFRTAENAYPLVQVGPGVFAANDTSGYTWTMFRPRVIDGVGKLEETYAGELSPESVVLRYINALPFDFTTMDVFAFVRENFRVVVELPGQLFSGQPVEPRPVLGTLESSYRATTPAGVLTLKFGRGEVNGSPHLMWDTSITSTGEDVPPIAGLDAWLGQAHDLVRAWFFTLIEGKLEEGFRS